MTEPFFLLQRDLVWFIAFRCSCPLASDVVGACASEAVASKICDGCRAAGLVRRRGLPKRTIGGLGCILCEA